MRNRHRRDLFDFGEGLAEATSASPAQQWAVGVGLAAVLGAYAVSCLVTQRALFPRRRPLGLVQLEGPGAIALGVAYLSVALFLHAHWFWSARPEAHIQAQFGKLVSLLGLVAGLGYFVYSALFLS